MSAPRTRDFLLFLSSAVLANAACHSALPRGSAPAAPELGTSRAPPAPLTRHSPILFEAGGRQTRLPFLSVSIAGHPSLMLLDTGATAHILGSWFVRKARLATRATPDEAALDHEGNEIPLSRADGVEMMMEGWGTLGIRSFLVSDLPLVLEQNGVAGILSPQLLVEAPNVVVDFPNRSLDEETDEASATRRLASGCWLPEMQPCARKDGPLFMVSGTIEAIGSTWVLDTGAIHADVNRSSPAAAHMLALSEPGTEAGIVVSGQTTLAPVARAVSLAAGQCTFRTDVDIIRGPDSRQCPYGGVLGIDVLRNCRIVMNRTLARGRCVDSP